MDFSLIGSGNVAHTLVNAFSNAGYNPRYLISRNEETGLALAEKGKLQFTQDYTKLSHKGLIIIAVNDDQIKKVAKKVPRSEAILIHTSGSISLNTLGGDRKRIGVMWPLQTFKSNRIISLKTIPICVEGNSILVSSAIKKIARQLSDKVSLISSEQRSKIHLAAVMANNFSNHLLKISFEEVEKTGVDRDILYPLIKTTFRNALKSEPSSLQTGPAKRADHKVIAKHLKMLSKNQKHSLIYKAMSESIIADYKPTE